MLVGRLPLILSLSKFTEQLLSLPATAVARTDASLRLRVARAPPGGRRRADCGRCSKEEQREKGDNGKVRGRPTEIPQVGQKRHPWKVTLEDLKRVREEEGYSGVRILTGSWGGGRGARRQGPAREGAPARLRAGGMRRPPAAPRLGITEAGEGGSSQASS